MPSAKPSRQDAENATLRKRIAQLEAQLVERQRSAASLQGAFVLAGQEFAGVRFGLGIFSDDFSRALFVGAGMAAIFGHTAEDIRADPLCWMQHVEEGDLPRVRESVAAAPCTRSESFRMHRNGGLRWIRLQISNMATGGQSSSVILLIADVTDTKLRAEALRDSELRFREFAVHSPTGIFQCDLDGKCQFVNDRFRTIAGASVAVLGRSWYGNIHPDDRRDVAAAWQEATASGAEFVYEFRFLHEDGEVRWALVSAVPLGGDAGNVSTYLGNVLDVTQRRAAEEALRTSEERFRLLSRDAPIGIFLSDEAGQVIYVNQCIQSIYDYRATELLGLGFARIWLPAEREKNLANWRRVACTTDSHDTERVIRNGRGETRQIHVRSAPMLSPTGTVLGRIGTVEDITERRLAEQELRDSEERFRLMAEYSTDMISKHYPGSVFTYVSAACHTLLGYEPQELLGTDGFDLLHPDDLSAALALADSMHNAYDNVTLTYRVRRKDGEYRWFECHWKLMPLAPDRNNRVRMEVIVVSRDITARRQAAELLQASEAGLRAILNTASDGIVTVDESGTIEQFNPGAEQLFGYKQEEVLGQSVAMLMALDDAARYDRRKRQPPELRRPLTGTREVFGRRKDGTLCDLEIRVAENSIGERKIFTSILHDVSERKKTERRLRESEKLAATGRIAARVAHEINNPLAGIKNSFLLIKDSVPKDHEHFSYVARIESEIDRIGRIVRQMFDLYSPAHSAIVPVEVDSKIRNTVELVEPIADAHDVTLEIDTPPLGSLVALPADSVRQVLYNLIINAIEASPRGGVVRITARTVDGALDVSISDQGPGIPPALHARIFEPFFTGKTRAGTGGLGLGLSISHGIVTALQGTLDFRCGPGTGTEFRLHIPAAVVHSKASNASDA